ncbi:hypothetical protein V4R14_00935 [Listeria monocytogenes]
MTNIENKSTKKHILIQLVLFSISTSIFVYFNLDYIIGTEINLKIIESYKSLILFVAIIASIIIPIINITFISLVFELILYFFKINLNFKTIFRISCIANYINLINIWINFFVKLDKFKFIYAINKFNIFYYIYIITINIILFKFLKNNNITRSDLKSEKFIFFIISTLIWLTSIVIKLLF